MRSHKKSPKEGRKRSLRKPRAQHEVTTQRVFFYRMGVEAEGKMALQPGNTPKGELAPYEVAKAIAFNEVITEMEKHMNKSCWELLGVGRKEFTASRLTKVGGGHPSTRAVSKHWTKAQQDPKWFPGKKTDNSGGRPDQITPAQKEAIATKAMELKDDITAPTPEKIRVCLPKKTINKSTGEPICDATIYRIFKTMCYDEEEDDPWQFLPSLQQDCLTSEDKPYRVKTAKHVLKEITENASWNFIAIDPCFSMLPRKEQKAELLKIAQLGHKKWMSKKSRRKGTNLRAPAFSKTQKEACDIVPWTPVFTRGRLKLVVLTEKNAQLNKSAPVAQFVRHQLPNVLEEMKQEWGWTNTPKVILHDKASYFVNKDQVNATFAAGLRAGRFKSWADDGCSWLGRHLGDFYPHETVIAHVRRLLGTKFSKCSLWETPEQFKARMLKVEHYMNYEMGDGESLQKLGRAYLKRAEQLKNNGGERLPK